MIEGIHRHVGTTHSKVGAHPLRPVTHVCQLIHDVERKVVIVVVRSDERRRSAEVEANRARSDGGERRVERSEG